MVTAQNQKFVSIVPPEAIRDDSSWTTAEIDTKGWEYLQIVAFLGATDIAMTALTATESDTSGSGHTNITGLIWGTSTNIAGSTSTLPSATDDDGFFVMDIDLRGRKRYIDLTITEGNGSAGGFVAVFGILSRGHATPMTATERGAVEVLRV